jgi:hypothetical protein
VFPTRAVLRVAALSASPTNGWGSAHCCRIGLINRLPKRLQALEALLPVRLRLVPRYPSGRPPPATRLRVGLLAAAQRVFFGDVNAPVRVLTAEAAAFIPRPAVLRRLSTPDGGRG